MFWILELIKALIISLIDTALDSSVQCQVNWSNSTDNQDCKVSNLKNLFYFFSELKSKAILDIMRSSGCYPKCKNVQYSIHKTETKINWPANWTASVFIFPKSSIVEYSSEYFSYDFNDCVGDIGGFLGLFLGWSLVTFIDAIPAFVAFMKMKTTKRY